jgi:hypothetical protein
VSEAMQHHQATDDDERKEFEESHVAPPAIQPAHTGEP